MKPFKAYFNNYLINEGYKQAYSILLNRGYDSDKIKTILTQHKHIKELNRLSKEHDNIDILVKYCTLEQIEQILSMYNQYTKKDIKTQLNNNIIGETDEYVCYHITTPEQAYYFHGKTKWCTNSKNLKHATQSFNRYIQQKYPFFICERINKQNNAYDYIALIKYPDNLLLWLTDDSLYVLFSTPESMALCPHKTFDQLPDTVLLIVKTIQSFICNKLQN